MGERIGVSRDLLITTLTGSESRTDTPIRHPRPVASQPVKSSRVHRTGGQLTDTLGWLYLPMFVVHVVRNLVVHVPRKTHKLLAITVSCGQLR